VVPLVSPVIVVEAFGVWLATVTGVSAVDPA